MISARSAGVLTVSLVLLAGAVAATGRNHGRSTSTSCTPVEGTEVCTWVTIESRGVVELGATIPLSVVEGVPLDAPMVWPPAPLARVALPEPAKRALGVDHMAINWEAHGHPPATFMTGHFDFHFNNLTPTQIDAIDCEDAAKPARLPAGYTLPDMEIPGLGTLVGLCVPRMGMHAMPDADASRTETFDASMLIGYYAGVPTFFEPMVSRETLLGRRDFALDVPEVDGLPSGVRYPTAFRADYDEDASAYRLVFTGF